jgi:hypothetical protein
MPDPTTNYGWDLPTVGGANGTWGTELNTIFNEIDTDLAAVSAVASAALPKAGGVMAGRIDSKTATMARQDKGSISGATNFDLAVAQFFTFTPSALVTMTFTNKPSGTFAYGVVLAITNGLNKVTWPTTTKWAGGTPPTLTASGIDLIGMITFDNGTIWHAFVLGQAFA